MYVIDSRESIKILDKAPFSRFSHFNCARTQSGSLDVHRGPGQIHVGLDPIWRTAYKLTSVHRQLSHSRCLESHDVPGGKSPCPSLMSIVTLTPPPITMCRTCA